MNLRQLEVFHAIMTSGSVTEAARTLNVTQPSVSTVLKHAETQLGVKLFQRIGGRLLPTPEADQLFPEIERIFSQLGMLRRFTKDLRDGRFGFLALIGNPTLTSSLLPIAIARFRARRPEVRVRLQTAISASQIADRVARREFDLGLVYGPNSDVHTGVEIIGYSRIACALRRDHPLAGNSRIRPVDLVGYDVITFGVGSPIRTMVDKNFADANCEVNAVVEVSFSATACVLAQEGAGVALIDPVIFRTETFPNLVTLPFTPARRIEHQLLFPKNRPRSEVSKSFEAELRAVIKNNDSARPA